MRTTETTRVRRIVTTCAVLVTLGGAAAAALAQGRDERREIRQLAMVSPDGASIGVRVKDLTQDELAKARTPSGAAVVDVVEGGPAQKAGLMEGDVVVEFDGERVRSARQLARLVEDTPEGRAVKVVVSRGGSKQTIEVTPVASRGDMAWMERLGPRVQERLERGMREFGPGLRTFEFDGPVAPGILVGRSPSRLGVGVEPLSDQLAAYFGAKDGVLVASVEANSPAEKAGLKAGDVIASVNGETISDPSDLATEVRRAAPGSTLTIEIVRDRKTQTLKAPLPEAPRRSTRRSVTA